MNLESPKRIRVNLSNEYTEDLTRYNFRIAIPFQINIGNEYFESFKATLTNAEIAPESHTYLEDIDLIEPEQYAFENLPVYYDKPCIPIGRLASFYPVAVDKVIHPKGEPNDSLKTIPVANWVIEFSIMQKVTMPHYPSKNDLIRAIKNNVVQYVYLNASVQHTTLNENKLTRIFYIVPRYIALSDPHYLL